MSAINSYFSFFDVFIFIDDKDEFEIEVTVHENKINST